MSRIEELIKEKCPDGVEYCTLLSVANILYGYPCDASLFNTEKAGKPLVRIRNILNGVSDTFTTEEVPKKYELAMGDLLVGMDGNFHVANWKINGGILCQRVCKVYSKDADNIVMNSYLSHILGPIMKKIEDKKQSGTVKHLSDKDIKGIEIPVPPIEVQREIVRILDKFTDLEAGLQAELEARKKQYEYYRMKLLTFDEDIELVELGNIVPSKRGKRVVKSQLSTNKGYPVYQNSLIPLGYHSEKNCKANMTFVICAGAAGEIGYSREDFWAADDCYYYECPSDLNNRYLFHVMMNQKKQLKDKVRKGSIPRISRDDVDSLVIPLPPLEKQIEIASKLDKWDTICNDSEAGLPAEIAARHKQYEYYRDKLLTFKRKVV